MVDVTSDFSQTRAAKPLTSFCGHVRCITNRAEALAYINALPKDVLTTGYQNEAFLRAWLQCADADPYFIVIEQSGHSDVLLPLELQPNGIATYCGGTHANGNFPVGLRSDIEALSPQQIKDILETLKTEAGAPDALFLERQHDAWHGCPNPFVLPSSSTSPNVALSFTLEGGFKSVLERHHGKRKRKRQRSHMRKLEAIGTVTIEQHVPCSDVHEILNAFFEMKAVRFREAGICDVFAEQSVKDMFAHMFMESCAMENPRHVLKAVRVDGKPISVIGCTIFDGRLTVEFGAFDDAFAIGGPGDLLFYKAIEAACEKGIDIFDFGIGDEFYKRSWCDIETWHRDTFLPVTTKGQIYCAYKKARNAAVHMAKTNKLAWSSIKLIRKYFGWMRKC